ncbi:MAG: metal ABC transporter ATP-binding protein [Muribaculaceae bacterium]|nr:metal ABC transporter ATP-binding protein [Muribaculaceae bacterium]
MQKLISLSDVAMKWDSRTVLSEVNLDINKGDFIAITGPNGGGKTTLLRIILKLLKPTSGRVTYYPSPEGKPLSIGYLPQKNMIDSHFPITVEEVISYGLISEKGLNEKDRGAMVNDTLELVGLTERRGYTISQLSGGQLQRALIGRALIAKPQMLVLDEPLNYIDKRFESRIYEIIEQVAPTTTIVLVSHEMSRIAAMANRHLIVNRGIEECHAGHHYFTLDCPCPNSHTHNV